MTANDIGDDNISPLQMTTSQIDEKLVRDQSTSELYMRLSSTVVLKWKKEMLYVPLDFENGLTVKALIDSGAYVSELAQSALERIEQQARANFFKIDEPRNWPVGKVNSNNHT